MNRHLTREEILEWLAGDRPDEAGRHLRECGECAAELRRMEAPIARFAGAVREWSAAQRVEFPVRRTGSLWLKWAGTAALLAVLIAIVVNGKREAGIEQQDDMLLEQVQAQVSESVPAPMEPLYRLMSEDGAK